MKLFCTVDDLIEVFDESEIKRLSNRGKPADSINLNVVNKAIRTASAEMTTYLAGRNILDTDTVPDVLVRIACDMSRYYLHQNPRKDSAPGEMYYKCLSQLKDIAKGVLNPGVDNAGKQVEPESTIQFNAGENMFKPPRGQGLW